MKQRAWREFLALISQLVLVFGLVGLFGLVSYHLHHMLWIHHYQRYMDER